MNPKRFLGLGLLVAALMVAACGPKAASEPTATLEPTATPMPLPPTGTPMPTATTVAPSEVAVLMGFTEEGVPYRGNPNAPVTLVEHSEFQ